MTKQVENAATTESMISSPPTGFQVIMREFKKDKLAMFSLIVLVVLILGIFIASAFIDKEQMMRISLRDKYAPPGDDFILGADHGGRSIMEQLILGAKNSILIAITITFITGIVGLVIGLITGYFGGFIDNLFMRIIDFFMTLPTIMIIIVFVTIIPKYNVTTFILILSIFLWIGTARLIRSKSLTESRRDYVSASKTMGTRNSVIIFKEIMPNLSSIIIIEMTLNFAGNVGIETALSFLGFGLPPSTPSLGTLVNYAINPEVLSTKLWIWAPASLLILVLMLGINYVGQALRRSADVRQRLG
ncbi:ABC transporter permease [Viridibacillus sp. YIM B01967]|uniref:ABC transporter permease n=1 Tax=Viridibacillus soli TaxID=2798301 RepID=A0ABS1HBJ4_9BACL|nr:ABC transporter permease [Viridibacillus soli]MBK3496831.1 ABC transporter permease [Viridibacillus soli]